MDALTAFVIILPVLTAAVTIASFFIARGTDAKKKGQDDGELKTDMSYVKRRVDDILLEQRETYKTLDVHGERIARIEENTKQAHKRIDELVNEVSRKIAAKE